MLTQAQDDIALVFAEHNVGVWDGSRIRKLIDLLRTIAPYVIPFIMTLFTPEQIKESEKCCEGEDEIRLTSIDLTAIFALIKVLWPFFQKFLDNYTSPEPTPAPVPTPTPGPVA